LFGIGVQVASNRGLAKKKLFLVLASPDWLMVERSSRRPPSMVRLSLHPPGPLPNSSPRVSSTLTEADGRGHGNAADC
jgi:hypothetical protein